MALASQIDFARLRADTPGCAHVLHLNAAGSALPSWRTLDATLDHLRLEAEIGGYEAAAKANDQLEGLSGRRQADRRRVRRDRLRRERDAPGTSPSTRSTSSRATAS